MQSKPDIALKHVLAAFALSLVVYGGFYSCDAHLRNRKGAWQVQFDATTNGEPRIVIAEPGMGIRNVQIIATGETQTTRDSTSVTFDSPQKPAAFGHVVFEDLTYLPGTVVLDLYGHEVQLIPRTLTVDGKEIRWQNDLTLRLMPGEKRSTRTNHLQKSRSTGAFGERKPDLPESK